MSAHVAVFRLTRGRLMKRWFGSPVLVIETLGRRTGRRRRTTVTYCPAEGGYVVAPINAGSDRTPAWWLNLREARNATILVGGRRLDVRAREAAGDERERLWEAYARQAPILRDFRDFTDRDVPVVVLEPRS